MRIAHLSDLHLGFRAFAKVERGWNLRERDVAAAFHHAIQEIGRLGPDLVLLTGNLFDHPDPPSTAFLTLTRGIGTLRELLPGVTICAVAGERDTPAAPADPGPVAVLDALPGVEAAAGAPRAVHLREPGVHILLVPYRSVIRPPYPQLRPDPDARWNVLLVRGTPGGEEGALPLDPRGWDYIALGGGPRARRWDRVGARIRTAGSLERVGIDPWREGVVEKGFWSCDLQSGDEEFHNLPGRPVVDLAPVRVDPSDPEAGSRRLRELLQGLPGGIEGKILRVRLRGREPGALAGIRPGLLEAIERQTAHLEIHAGPTDLRLPGLLRERPASPSGLPRLLRGAEGEDADEIPLTPGLWALMADSREDRVRLARLADGGGGSRGLPLAFVRPEEERGSQARGEVDVAGEALPAPSPSTGDSTPETARELRRLREDWLEATGDMEALSLEWVRERQEAESRLASYRDHARELRDRLREIESEGADALCPTCRRPLAEAHPRMVRELREEWEDVVQDGQWWRRRREQLEEKPDALRVLDRQVLELQARMEALAEASTHPVEPVPEPATKEGWGGRPSGHGEIPAPGDPRVLGLAADFLGRVTGGRIRELLVDPEHGGVAVREDGGEWSPPPPGDFALVSAALHLATVGLDLHDRVEADEAIQTGEEGMESGEGGAPAAPSHLVLGHFAESDGSDEVVRFFQLLAGEPLAIPVVAVLPPGVAARLPERLVGTVELRRDPEKRARIRVGSAGRPRLRIEGDG